MGPIEESISRNKNFTGHPDILHRLREGLAIEYTWRFSPEYTLIWWISADQLVRVRSSLGALTPHLGCRLPTVAGIEDAATAVLDALLRGKPYK